jgi:heme exporter protein A
MLSIENININIGPDALVSNFNLTLLPGAVLNIFGANGCGKTSLLNIICGLNIPQGGNLFLWQQDVTQDLKQYLAVTEHIGHSHALHYDLSVKDNLWMWASLYDTQILLPAAIHTLGLQDYVEVEVKNLSMGLKRRTALARLLLTQKTIWLLDEPFANLDAQYREVVMQMIFSRCSHQGMVIFTSHERIIRDGVMNVQLDYAVK